MAKFCQTCGNQIIDNNAPFCPKCGAKLPITSPAPQPQNPKPQSNTKKRSTVEWIAIGCGGIILLVIVSAFIAGMISGISGASQKTSTTAGTQQPIVPPTPTIDPIIQIKNNVQNIPYDDLFRYNENYIGKTVYFRGKIIQIIPVYSDSYEFRVATKQSQYLGYSDDVIYVNYKGSRFLEGDIIDLWGKVEGLETYSSVFKPVTIPKLTALHAELVEKGS